MARRINRLSARTVETITASGRHADGGNLFLVVDKRRPNAKSIEKPGKRWVFLYRWNGRLREMGLGPLTGVTLGRARELATNYRAVLADGRDPIDARRAELALESGKSFGDVATSLYEGKKSGWKNEKVTKQWLTTLQRYTMAIWSKPVASVGIDDVLAILQPIWTEKAETASRVRARIEATIDAARALGLIPQDKANPARWRGHLSHLLPKRQRLQRGHHAALPYAEIGDFMAGLRERPAIAALCLEFLILTASRTSEALLAEWSEFDLPNGLWTISAIRMKSARAHRVPLSYRCLHILDQLEKLKTHPTGYVFPGQRQSRPLSGMALEMLLRRMGVAITVHGFRSTFRDWAGDCTAFPREVAEAALAHAVGDEAERAYRRSDALEKRRELMAAWAHFCASTGKDRIASR